MNVNCYQISEGPRLNPCEYDFAVEAVRKQKTRIWIDILDTDEQSLMEKLDELNVQGLIRRLCLGSRDHPGFYPFKPLTLMVLPVQLEQQDFNKTDYMTLLFDSDTLISIRNSKMARFLKGFTSEDLLDLLPDDSIFGIISTWMLGLSLDLIKKTAKLSEMIMVMEEQMEKDPKLVVIEDITSKRLELLTMESIVQGQLPIIETTISSGWSAKIPESALEHLRWAVANLKSADRKLQWLEHRLEVLRSMKEMFEQEKTNRRLGRLTVLSAIFMPVTFLVGIWGMNFKHMPTISMEYGFVIAMTSMALISGVMFYYFKTKGWFD